MRTPSFALRHVQPIQAKFSPDIHIIDPAWQTSLQVPNFRVEPIENVGPRLLHLLGRPEHRQGILFDSSSAGIAYDRGGLRIPEVSADRYVYFDIPKWMFGISAFSLVFHLRIEGNRLGWGADKNLFGLWAGTDASLLVRYDESVDQIDGFVRNSADTADVESYLTLSEVGNGQSFVYILTADGSYVKTMVWANGGEIRTQFTTALSGPYIPSTPTSWKYGECRSGTSPCPATFFSVQFFDRGFSESEMYRLIRTPYRYLRAA